MWRPEWRRPGAAVDNAEIELDALELDLELVEFLDFELVSGLDGTGTVLLLEILKGIAVAFEVGGVLVFEVFEDVAARGLFAVVGFVVDVLVGLDDGFDGDAGGGGVGVEEGDLHVDAVAIDVEVGLEVNNGLIGKAAAEGFPFGVLHGHVNGAAVLDDGELRIDVGIVHREGVGVVAEDAGDEGLDLDDADAAVLGLFAEEVAGGGADEGANDGEGDGPFPAALEEGLDGLEGGDLGRSGGGGAAVVEDGGEFLRVAIDDGNMVAHELSPDWMSRIMGSAASRIAWAA